MTARDLTPEISAQYKLILHRLPTEQERTRAPAASDADLRASDEYLSRIESIEEAVRDEPDVESPSLVRRLKRRNRNRSIRMKLDALQGSEALHFAPTPESRKYADSVEKQREKIMSASTAATMLSIHQKHPYEEWRSMTGRVHAMLRLRPNDYLFDAGFGSGAPATDFLERTPSLQIAGCDFCKLYVEHANATPPLQGHTWFHMFSEKLVHFPSAQFDAAMSIGTMVYQSDPRLHEQIVSNLLRVTRPGGRVFVGTLQDPHNLPGKTTPGTGFLDKSRLADLASANGARIVAIGSDREMVGAKTERHHPDKRYSVLFERNPA